MNSIKVALLGFGNVGRAVTRYLASGKGGPGVTIAAVADSSGGLLLSPTDPLPDILAAKEAGASIRDSGQPVHGISEFIGMLPGAGISVLVESLPTSIQDGQPALGMIESALRQGTSVVTVDKGPLVHGFRELNDAARDSGARLGYSGTTGIRPPDELTGSRVLEIRGVLNGTTNYILTRMQGSLSFQGALDRAISDGVAEPDPSLDVEGWDTACKILILAKALMGAEALLDEVSRIGIGPETESLIGLAKARGRVVRLVGRARIWQGRVRVSVAPKLVGPDSPFFSVSGTSKAAIFRTAERGEMIAHATSGRDSISQTIVEDILRVPGQA